MRSNTVRIRATFLLVLSLAIVKSTRAADSNPIADLSQYLKTEPSQRAPLGEQGFANRRLSKSEADRALGLLWQDHRALIKSERAAEMKTKVVTDGKLKMPFYYRHFGKQPKDGWSLFISLHGGGGTPARVNDQQWENQKRLYKLQQGIYLVPRAPTNTWNLWHQKHIDWFFDRLIENFVVFENVNPDRVYVMGYSAGGDGVYQLAPRMADRWAAASMMAGHPNETSPLGLRNIGFAIFMGGRDSAYNRNKVAADWKNKLGDLQKNDPQGYSHQVTIYPEKGHWMGLKDAAALPWLDKFKRNPFPKKVVWKQDDVTHNRFYWLSVSPENRKARSLIVAQMKNQQVTIEKADIDSVFVRLNDRMADLDQEIVVRAANATVFQGKVHRTIAVIAKTLAERGDRNSTFSAEIEVKAR